ncbi:MAG: hypothetical protein Q9181_007689 [Wetmoreana brouardii]
MVLIFQPKNYAHQSTQDRIVFAFQRLEKLFETYIYGTNPSSVGLALRSTMRDFDDRPEYWLCQLEAFRTRGNLFLKAWVQGPSKSKTHLQNAMDAFMECLAILEHCDEETSFTTDHTEEFDRQHNLALREISRTESESPDRSRFQLEIARDGVAEYVQQLEPGSFREFMHRSKSMENAVAVANLHLSGIELRLKRLRPALNAIMKARVMKPRDKTIRHMHGKLIDKMIARREEYGRGLDEDKYVESAGVMTISDLDHSEFETDEWSSVDENVEDLE